MKTKLEMAHEWAMKIIEGNMRAADASDLIERAWAYADAMQAEADKREKEEQSEHVFEAIDEWQPDWSQAPDGYNYWAFDGFSKRANWYKGKPYLDEDSEIEDEWNAELGKYHEAPSFGYTGDWRNSLRKRPK